jgi:hypothetical protein
MILQIIMGTQNKSLEPMKVTFVSKAINLL